jgi:hypothetical protein
MQLAEQCLGLGKFPGIDHFLGVMPPTWQLLASGRTEVTR